MSQPAPPLQDPTTTPNKGVTMNRLQMAVRQAEVEVSSTMEELARRMRTLSECMARSAERLEQNRPGTNSMGEVQGRGTGVDRLCAVLQEQERKLDLLRRLAAEQEDE